MKTSDAIRWAHTASNLASILNITPGAVSQWGEEVPQGRLWQLRVLRPDWFEPDGSPRPPPAISSQSTQAPEAAHGQ